MKAVLEGLLFIVGEDGLSIEQVSEILEIDVEESKKIIQELKIDYENKERGLRIDYLGNKIKLTTKREHKEYYQKLIENKETNTLSQAALEVLAIIAYNEPITRAQVNELRGVDCGNMVRKLVSKGFVKETGRSELPGRPILYETTSEFLDYFGLPSIDALPDMRDFITPLENEKENDEVDLYHSKYKEDKEEDFEKENNVVITEIEEVAVK